MTLPATVSAPPSSSPPPRQRRIWPYALISLIVGGLVGAFLVTALVVQPMKVGLAKMAMQPPAIGATPGAANPGASSTADTQPDETARDTPGGSKNDTSASSPTAGLYIGDPSAFSRSQLTSLVKQAGRQHLSLGILVPWKNIETKSGSYHWGRYNTIREIVARYNRNHATHPVSVSIDAAYAPHWASGSCRNERCAPTTSHINSYGSFTAAIAKRYSTAGAPATINVWHHANRSQFFANGTPKLYAQLFNAAAKQVLAAKPKALVHVGPLAPASRAHVAPVAFVKAAHMAGLTAPGVIWLETSSRAAKDAKAIRAAYGMPDLTVNVRMDTASPTHLKQAAKTWSNLGSSSIVVNALANPNPVASLPGVTYLT